MNAEGVRKNVRIVPDDPSVPIAIRTTRTITSSRTEPMFFKHENLEVYKLAMELVKIVYKIIRKFPKEELYGLTSQIKNSVVSVVLNIAEGSGRWTSKDFSRFVRQAIASLLETDAALKVGISLEYINKGDYQSADPIIEKLYFKLIGLDKSLKRMSNV